MTAPMRVSGRRGTFPVSAGRRSAGQIVGSIAVMVIRLCVMAFGATRSGALLGFYGLILIHFGGSKGVSIEGGESYKLLGSEG